MKLVIQRVEKAEVSDADKDTVIGKIGKGLFVLIGIGKNDTKTDAELFAKKLINMRIMSDNEGKMNLTVSAANGEFLIVSQFTLLADVSGGNRPSFVGAAKPRIAEKIYTHFLNELKASGVRIKTGKFGAYMKIQASLDGPVTINI